MERRAPRTVLYITPSGKGLKVVFKADPNVGNLIDNQHEMAKVLGVEVDESCKDASRMSFICKEEDILYIDKELFTYENKEFAERYTALYRDGRSQGTREMADVRSQKEDVETQPSDTSLQPSFKGRPYSEIIDEWWQKNGGVPQEGERNVKLYQLAVNLRAICDNKAAKRADEIHARNRRKVHRGTVPVCTPGWQYQFSIGRLGLTD